MKASPYSHDLTTNNSSEPSIGPSPTALAYKFPAYSPTAKTETDDESMAADCG